MDRLKNSLPLQMAIAVALGILSGLLFGDLNAVFAPWTEAYIMVLKITILPYLVCAIVHGVGQLSDFQAKEILKKGILFVSIAWAINIFSIYLINFSFPQVKGHASGVYTTEPTSSIHFSELLIPENIFYSLSNNIVPAIVVFALLVGIALMHIREKQAAMSALQTTVDALTRITQWISRITPIGTFIIIATQVGTIELNTVKQISTYLIFYMFGVSLLIFWILPRLTSMLTPLSALKWLRDLLPVLLLAYTTTTIIVCLPFIMQLIEKETENLNLKDENTKNQIQGTVSIIFNLPLGSLFIALFVLFSSLFYNSPLTLLSQVKLFLMTFLTGLGSVGIGAWINSLTFLVDSLGLPLDAIDIFITTLPFTSGFQAMVSAMEIATISLLIILSCRKALTVQWSKIIKGAAFTLLPIFLLIGALCAYNPFPPIQNQTRSIHDVSMHYPIPVTVVSPSPSHRSQEDLFDRILRTKVLRVGYNTNVIPFCFFNHDGQIVGYDIAFACQLAQDLGCRLELVPMNYRTLAKDLDAGVYDIAMSAVSINEERLKQMSFSNSYSEGKFVFIVKDSERKQFANFKDVQNNPSLRIAVLKGSAFELTAKVLFPNRDIVLLNSYDAFLNTSDADALLWSEPQAISWVINHPHYHVVAPQPGMGISSLGYPMNEQQGRFLTFINQWLELKKNEGFTQEQYNFWVLGKTETRPSGTRHWSILNSFRR